MNFDRSSDLLYFGIRKPILVSPLNIVNFWTIDSKSIDGRQSITKPTKKMKSDNDSTIWYHISEIWKMIANCTKCDLIFVTLPQQRHVSMSAFILLIENLKKLNLIWIQFFKWKLILLCQLSMDLRYFRRYFQHSAFFWVKNLNLNLILTNICIELLHLIQNSNVYTNSNRFDRLWLLCGISCVLIGSVIISIDT